MENGLAPYVPHLSHFQDMMFRRDYEEWMALDFAWIERCDALVRLSGASHGADREVVYAQDLGKLVLFEGPYLGREKDVWRLIVKDLKAKAHVT